ncbi:MAG TPA: DUF6335 family protein [Candidatus Binatia bacterium]|nr:DUF6335 family protein [Candidatus Binatia bacterium]
MARKARGQGKSPKEPRRRRGRRTEAARREEEARSGPPPREATILRSDRERQAAEDLDRQTASSPRLSGGDIDADWRRGDVGEEAVGGSVATPDQDVVDELGEAWGVPRAPDDEVRTSGEILEERDRYRREQED